ncbi:hypothetical protein [Streptomyces cinereoruber]
MRVLAELCLDQRVDAGDLLALARRRVNVLWALLRDGRTYEIVSPTARAA